MAVTMKMKTILWFDTVFLLVNFHQLRLITHDKVEIHSVNQPVNGRFYVNKMQLDVGH